MGVNERRPLPNKMRQLIQQVFQQLGIPATIRKLIPVVGGVINDTYQVLTDDQPYFVKTKTGIPSDFFKKEQNNLALIRQTHTIAVPKDFGEWYDPQTKRGVLVLEWIEGKATEKSEAQLGHDLALLHACYGSKFGNQEDNYIGLLPQPNGWSSSWTTFFRDQRIHFQLEYGYNKGVIRGSRYKKLEKLMNRIDDSWFSHQPKPSPLHGDLWSGNWIPGPAGKPYLIDPASFYGDRELDIAFTECFGGYSESFYQAYQAQFPLSPTYSERKKLYMLLFLLIHLNLFGEKYGERVDQILHYYVGK